MSTHRDDYYYFLEMSTRWSDNDVYGHINNVVYYSYFDSIANHYLIEHAGLDIHAADTVAFVVASSCNYHAPLSYPGTLTAGFRVNRLGNKSVEYGVAIFAADSNIAAANGNFTHVFVNRKTGKSVVIPASMRTALERALVQN